MGCGFCFWLSFFHLSFLFSHMSSSIVRSAVGHSIRLFDALDAKYAARIRFERHMFDKRLMTISKWMSVAHVQYMNCSVFFFFYFLWNMQYVLHLRALELGRKIPIVHQFHWYDTHYYVAMNAKRSQMNELRHRMPTSCAKIARSQIKKKGKKIEHEIREEKP